MSSAVAFIQWDNYDDGPGGHHLFGSDPLTYNSRQERLHLLRPGDRLWLVSRAPDDQQYYFVGCLAIAMTQLNPTGSSAEIEFGRFAVIAESAASIDLGKHFPAEGLLRAFQFDSDKLVKFGASLGQSIQTIRLITPTDEKILNAVLQRILAGKERALDTPFGLWTKCDRVFAEFFSKNWQTRQEPLAFLLYDSPPVLTPGSPVFIHSDKNLRLVATFRESQYVAGHKNTVPVAERISERERIWLAHRASTLSPPSRPDFDAFWERQNGVRALFMMDNLFSVSQACPFRTYGQGLQWGYPIGVGYRYLTFSQCVLLLRYASVPPGVTELYIDTLLRTR
jgi:hypothetical protein